MFEKQLAGRLIEQAEQTTVFAIPVIHSLALFHDEVTLPIRVVRIAVRHQCERRCHHRKQRHGGECEPRAPTPLTDRSGVSRIARGEECGEIGRVTELRESLVAPGDCARELACVE